MDSSMQHLAHTAQGADYEKEFDSATQRSLYIPVVIDDKGGRHRLEQLGCKKAQTALEVAAAAREEVLAQFAEEERIKTEQRPASVDGAVGA